MKHTLILALLLFPAVLFSQDKKWYHVSNNDKWIMGLQAVAGASDGLNQVLTHHIHTFERYYPNADMSWWDPIKSQERKNHMWTPISDGYHLTRSFEHVSNYVSIGISAGDILDYPKKDRVKRILFKIAYSYLVNRIAFNTVYKVGFNDRIEREKAGIR